MPLPRTGFQVEFDDLSPGTPEFGSVSLLPWDTDFFGFPVGLFRTGAPELTKEAARPFRDAFASWAERNGVALCSCAIGAAEGFWKRHLPALGFLFVDCGAQATLSGLHRASLPEARTELRPSQPGDQPAIEALAAGSFHHGRYHADPCFPRAMASLRYRNWMRNALSRPQSIDRVYVMGPPGEVQGFYHVTVEDEVADLRLAAIAPEFQGTLLGFELYSAMLLILKGLGVRRVVTSISVANTAVMNVYASLGFRFSKPEIVYHWHAPQFEWSC